MVVVAVVAAVVVTVVAAVVVTDVVAVVVAVELSDDQGSVLPVVEAVEVALVVAVLN
jgi:hypothetical protein